MDKKPRQSYALGVGPGDPSFYLPIYQLIDPLWASIDLISFWSKLTSIAACFPTIVQDNLSIVYPPNTSTLPLRAATSFVDIWILAVPRARNPSG